MIRKSQKSKQELQERLVYFAKKNLGKPYKHGAKSEEAPKTFDCSSFTQYLYKRIGIELPRTGLQQAHFGKKINPKKQKLEIGDLIFIHGQWGHYNPEFPQGIGHVGMYIGNGQVIQASAKTITKWKNLAGKIDGKIKQVSLNNFLKKEKLITIKRIL